MARHRMYEYRFRDKAQYRHICLFGENRGNNGSGEGKAAENTAAILEELEAKEKGLHNLSRSRRTIYDYIMCNKFDMFCTFTFDPKKHDRYDFKEGKRVMSKFFKLYRQNHAPDFKYIAVPEFHKDGAVHFHGMVKGIRPGDLTVPERIYRRKNGTNTLELVPNTKGYVDWGNYSKHHGWFSCSLIKDYEKCAVYVSKYITKDLCTMELGQRVFLASKGLEKPELVEDIDGIPLLFAPDFSNDFCAILDTNDSLGLVPDWYGEQCSELRDAPVYMDAVTESDAIFPRLTGNQLKIHVS